MNSIAFTQQHRIFKRLESVTNYYNLDDAQRRAYDEDLKIYRDFQNCMDFREAKGRAEGEAIGIAKGEAIGIAKGEAKGRAEERFSVAKEMLAKKMDLDLVMEFTKLSKDQLESLL